MEIARWCAPTSRIHNTMDYTGCLGLHGMPGITRVTAKEHAVSPGWASHCARASCYPTYSANNCYCHAVPEGPCLQSSGYIASATDWLFGCIRKTISIVFRIYRNSYQFAFGHFQNHDGTCHIHVPRFVFSRASIEVFLKNMARENALSFIVYM